MLFAALMLISEDFVRYFQTYLMSKITKKCLSPERKGIIAFKRINFAQGQFQGRLRSTTRGDEAAEIKSLATSHF